MCSANWARDLHHKNKHKLMRNLRMSINVVHVEILSKQKDSPSLAFLDKNLSVALENEHGEKAYRTWVFLRTINDHVV